MLNNASGSGSIVQIYNPSPKYAITSRMQRDTHELKKQINNHAQDKFVEKCRFTLNIFRNHKRDQTIKNKYIKLNEDSPRRRLRSTFAQSTKKTLMDDISKKPRGILKEKLLDDSMTEEDEEETVENI